MRDTVQFLADSIPTPIGTLRIAADVAGRLCVALFTETDEIVYRYLRRHSPEPFTLVLVHNPHGFSNRIAAYFAGELNAIDDLPVDTGGSPFQRDVWQALRTIPCGTTTSYGKLAARIGRPSAVRAVGLANGANPIAVVLPCHRVVGSNGSLTGYGGGIERKRWLLEHECKGQLLF